MAKWFGKIGFEGQTVETAPSVFTEEMVEREYYGDVLEWGRQLQAGDGVNDNVTFQNRLSIVADPLRRGNTGDNTPAAITVHLVDGEGCRITVAPKGFGSENMSQIKMLKPADGVEGFKKFVLDTVKLAGSNPCPPIVLGIGVGGSFDKVAYLAKKALLRPLDVPNPDPYYAQLEQELLTAINGLGIGPQGFGGRTTCLGLAIEQMPTHVAGLPVAVNVSCHVTRRASAEL